MTADRTVDEDAAPAVSIATPRPRQVWRPQRAVTADRAVPGMPQLYFAVEAARRDRRTLIVQFVGADGGEGVSTVVAGYVHQAARRPDARILLVGCTRAAAQGSRPLPDLLDAFESGRALLDATIPLPGTDVPPGSVRLASLGEHADESLDPSLLEPFAAALRQSFGLVVLDCPSVAAGPLAAVLSRIADGTVLVVAAGRTRRRGLQQAVAEINGMGGQVIGMVLNRQRDWLPGWLRRRIA